MGCPDFAGCWLLSVKRIPHMLRKFKKIFFAFLCITVAIILFCACYIKAHPLVFNESLFEHAHCIVITGLAFKTYANDHYGQFPFDTNGYGNALLLLTNYVNNYWACLTGPSYDGHVFAMAAQTGRYIPDVECGRVYVQGLCETNDPEIALFFDKLPTPGGDHCHGIHRILAPLAREIWTVGGDRRVVNVSEWDAFAKRQVDLLVAAGIARPQAEEYYSEKRKN
jgi:hypothetical protein